ncbi:MAG: ABC transporter permease [Actinomycetota bacterium]|nr:ABC transporter permease [Actinomycetota bacterium]
MDLRAALGRFGRPLLGVAVFVGALLVWEVWAGAEESFLAPPASDVLQQAWEIWPTRDFLTEVAGSLKRLAAGFAIGGAIGIAIGLVTGTSRAVRRALDPLIELARATPPIAIVPALILTLGFGDSMRIAVIAFGVCFPVLINTVEGIRAVSPEARDTASMLHVGRMERVFRIYLKAALPSIVAGLRVALSTGLVLVVISEFAGEGGGLGHYILDKQGQFAYPEMYAGILFLGLLGYGLNLLFRLAERRVLAWHYGAVGERAR